MAFALLLLSFHPALQSGDALEKARALVEQFRSDDIAVREKATKALIELGEAVISVVEKAAKDPDAEVSRRAEGVLRHFRAQLRLRDLLKSDLGEFLKAEPAIRDALSSGSPQERAESVQRIAGIKRTSSGVEEIHRDKRLAAHAATRARLLVEFLAGELSEVAREEALYGLYLINRRRVEQGEKPVQWEGEPGIAAAVLERTRTEHPINRVVATSALSSVAGRAAEDRIAELIADEHPCVRYIAMRSLQSRLASGRADLVAGRFKDSDRFCSLAAIEILGYLGGSQVEPIIRSVLREQTQEYQRAVACWTAGRLRLPLEAELRGLIESELVTADRRPETTSAVKALALVGGPESIPTMARMLSWTSERRELLVERTHMRRDAAAALARWNLKKNLEPVKELMSSDDPEVRTIGASLLVRTGETVEGAVLASLLGEETSFRPHLLVALLRLEQTSAPVPSKPWTLMNWRYATGVTHTVANSVHKGVQLPFLYWYSWTGPASTLASEAGKAGGIEVIKSATEATVTVTTPMPDPTVGEALVALAAQGWALVPDGKAYKLVTSAEAASYWRDRLKQSK